MKKGQVSIFIIVGLLIVTVVGFLLLLSSRSIKNNIAEQARVEDVEEYMDSCVKDILKASTSQDGILVEDINSANQNLKDYIKNNIRFVCEEEIDINYRNIEKPQDISIDVDLKKYNGIGSIGQYEKVIVRVTYDAKVIVDNNKFSLKPMLIEYEY